MMKPWRPNQFVVGFRYHLLSLLCLLAAAAFAQHPPVGRVVMHEGRVTAHTADGLERTLQDQSPVYNGDEIVTAAGAKVQIVLLDHTTISQGAQSTLRIDNYTYNPQTEEGRSLLHLLRGVFRSVSGRIAEIYPERFEIKTGRAIIGVRGCDLIFDLQEQVESIHVLELPAGRFIRVTFIYLPEGLDPGSEVTRVIDIPIANQALYLFPDGSFDERTLPPGSLDRLIRELGLPPSPVSERVAGEAMRQGELASLLVRMLGLRAILPPNPTQADYFAILEANGISPFGGWQANRPVWRGDLARVLVQCMGLQDLVDDPRRPADWIAVIESLGVPLDTTGGNLPGLYPLSDPIWPSVFNMAGSRDPLLRRRTGQPDEKNFGVDVELIFGDTMTPDDVRRIIQDIQLPRPPRRQVTPD